MEYGKLRGESRTQNYLHTVITTVLKDWNKQNEINGKFTLF